MNTAPMTRSQVFLRLDQKHRLQKYAKKMKKKSSELIRESIDFYLNAQHHNEENWKENILRSAGVFSDAQGEAMQNALLENKKQSSHRISSVFA